MRCAFMHHSKATLALAMRPLNAWLKGPYDEQAVLACFQLCAFLY